MVELQIWLRRQCRILGKEAVEEIGMLAEELFI
jgi:hypothetical protein